MAILVYHSGDVSCITPAQPGPSAHGLALEMWPIAWRRDSPYLLQHASNPVDWWEWGEEAFAEARRRNVPLLLSVGYAACHWCHEVDRSTAFGGL